MQARSQFGGARAAEKHGHAKALRRHGRHDGGLDEGGARLLDAGGHFAFGVGRDGIDVQVNLAGAQGCSGLLGDVERGRAGDGGDQQIGVADGIGKSLAGAHIGACFREHGGAGGFGTQQDVEDGYFGAGFGEVLAQNAASFSEADEGDAFNGFCGHAIDPARVWGLRNVSYTSGFGASTYGEGGGSFFSGSSGSGFPCSSFCYHADRSDRLLDLRGRGIVKSKKTYEEGLAVRREVLGEEYVDRAMASADSFTGELQDFVTEWCWGGVWTRPGLPRKTRSLLNLAMLAALNRPHEIKMHVRGALNGVTREEIAEVFLQAGV